jgi:hypothetical protein
MSEKKCLTCSVEKLSYITYFKLARCFRLLYTIENEHYI